MKHVSESVSCVQLRLYSPWNSPDQITGVGSLSLLQGSSRPRDWTQVSHIAGRVFTSWAIREAQEYWSGQPIPSPMGLSNPGIKPRFPALQVDSLPTELSGMPETKPRTKNKTAFCSRGRNYLSPDVVCYTNILEIIIQNKGLGLCSEDVQKCEKLMDNCLPKMFLYENVVKGIFCLCFCFCLCLFSLTDT